MINIKNVCEYFFSESIYCFTSDLDWAPECDTQDTVDIFKELGLPLTIFVTHHSEVVNKTYKDCREHVGIHPNFRSNSTHGTNAIEQLNHCQGLWPEARYLRTHSTYDTFPLSLEMVKRGFKYDSSLCLFLQPYCTPLRHCSGLVRFPIFWEDDVHAMKGIDFQLVKILESLNLPGLKIFNFHPTNLFSSNAILGNVAFLRELAEYVQSNHCKVMYLDDLYSLLGTI